MDKYAEACSAGKKSAYLLRNVRLYMINFCFIFIIKTREKVNETQETTDPRSAEEEMG